MSRKQSRSSAWQDQIESTLQRIHRQSSGSTVARPPDEASAAIGRRLATRLMDGLREENAQETADKIVACICESNTSPSLAYAFFDALTPHTIFLEWMPRWILQMEEANDTLCHAGISYLIRAYATCCCSLQNVSLESIADTFSRIKLSSSRTCTLREFVRVAYLENKAPTMLTPFIASCVVDNSPRDEKMVFLQSVWREMWSCIKKGNDRSGMVAMLSFMSESLHVFLNCITCEQRECQHMSTELAYQWLTELVDMTTAAYQALVELFDMHEDLPSDQSLVDDFATLFSMIVDKILPHFFVTTLPAMESVIMQLVNMMEIEVMMEKRVIARHVDCSTWFRLGTLMLSTPIKKDVCSLLTLIVELPNPGQDLVQGLLHSLACIFAHDDQCKESAKQMYALAASDGKMKESGDLTSMIQLFQEGNDDESLLRFMTASLENIDPLRLSAMQQNAALLLGCSLVRQKRLDEALVYSYLNALLQRFPHLGITLLPVLFQSIQTACDTMDGAALLRHLDFLCDAVVKDPHCAQEVWNLIGVTLIQPDSPTGVRSVAIRMYPRLCASNKRLYRRVIDTLGSLVDSSEPEIRLAVVSTIDDLAREDRIRDVADVIGWVQAYLSDENSSVVHYAVLTLHHLVVAQELDFDLVVKVLNKRLCPVGDVDQLLALPGTVLEALVLLLGDGKCDNVHSDEDDEATSSRNLVGVSPQVSGAVGTLIQLAGSVALSPTNSSSNGLFTHEMISHIRQNIYKSLSNYSLRALGLEDEGVRSATVDQEGFESGEARAISEAGLRYAALRRIASDGIQYTPVAPDSSSPDPTVILARKILALEEDSLGSSIWKKGGKTSSSSKLYRTSAPKAAFSALPSPDLIHRTHTENPSFSTSVASLLCYSGNSVGDLFDFASDISEGSHDPIFQVFNLQGWLHAMGMIWADIIATNDRSKIEAVTSVVKEVNRWRGLLGTADIAYLALATFTMFVPDTLISDSSASSIDFSHFVESIRDEIWLAYEGHQFQSRDAANLCLGLIGVRAFHCRSNAVVEKSIEMLEHSLQEQGGQTSFGACYGLAMIAQTGSVFYASDEIRAASSNVQTLSWINRIVALLVNEIQMCFQDSIPAFVTLVACLKTGKTSPDLLHSIMAVTDEVIIPDTSAQKVRSLLLSLALCVRAVDTVSNDLMLCVYMFTEKLPWGTGKGFVLPNAALQCTSSGMLRRTDADFFIKKHEREVESLFEAGNSSGFSDALYASIAMKTYEASTKSTMDGLLFVRHIFENYGSCKTDESYSMLTLSAALLVSSFPCMGNSGPLFCSAASLHPQVTKETVSTIISLLSDVTEGSGRNKSTGVATQLLGLLASMKGGPSHVSPCSVFGKNLASSETLQNTKQSQLSLERLPNPQEGSLLEAIMGLLQQNWGRIPSSTTSFVRLLSCLESLSLPSQFARSLIEPMLTAYEHEELKPSCIALLISQISGRRRAAFDGRDFVKLVSRLALLPPASFQSMVGDLGSINFISSLHSFLSKLPTDSVEDVLLNLWKICDVEIKGKCKVSCAVGYLRSVSMLLEPKKKTDSSRLSPRTHTIIIQVLLQPIFSTLCHNVENLEGIRTGTDLHAVEEAFLDCLTSIELPILEETHFFLLKGDKDSTVSDLSKAFWTVRLVYRKYFEENRASKELFKAIAWFAHQRGATYIGDVSDAVLRELAATIAIATKAEDQTAKKDIVALLFEALHVQGPGTLCLELLGMLLCIWSDGVHCDSESSSANMFFSGAHQFSMLHPETLLSLSKLLLYDLPSNVGAYARSERLRGLVSNRVLRIHKSWSKHGDAQRDLSILEGILMRCRTLDTKEQDLTPLVILRLTAPSCTSSSL